MGTWTIIGIICFGMYGCPRYRVWSSEMDGRAEMAKAEQNKKIQIEEARANLEAQKLNSEAEVERAKGMAKAIEIENGKLTDLYIKYLWVRQGDMSEAEKIIYVPTEANLPILEAKE
jgi:regulator of protease activity HflC (stomatin/prohibitin superfamily)